MIILKEESERVTNISKLYRIFKKEFGDRMYVDTDNPDWAQFAWRKDNLVNLTDEEMKSIQVKIYQIAKDNNWSVALYHPTQNLITGVLEPHYTKKISKLPEILYHVSFEENVDSILKNGLESRTSGEHGNDRKTDLPRVYLTYNFQSAVMIALMLSHFDYPKPYYNYKPVIFEVDVSGLNLNYYKDGALWEDQVKGIWTPTSIPANRLKLIARGWEDIKSKTDKYRRYIDKMIRGKK